MVKFSNNRAEQGGAIIFVGNFTIISSSSDLQPSTAIANQLLGESV